MSTREIPRAGCVAGNPVRRSTGFSLIELLVVIAAIAILELSRCRGRHERTV